MMNEKEQLFRLYGKLKEIRKEGGKMKDIAAKSDLPPSVLSALYATVLPYFCEHVDKLGFDEAIDQALARVNNLSRRKLLDSLDELCLCVAEFEREHSSSLSKGTPSFLHVLSTATAEAADKIGRLEGIYMSYSCSSSVRALKAESFYLTTRPGQHCLAAGRKSVHGSIREGIGIIQEQQILYLMLNAFHEPNLSLVTVYLQLPFLEDIHYLKGLYLVPDYNRNPIARRIVLIKLSDTYSPEEFDRLPTGIIFPQDFTDEQEAIYHYTCGQSDAIKMCTLPSPKLDLRDLQAEKKLLERESEWEEQEP